MHDRTIPLDSPWSPICSRWSGSQNIHVHGDWKMTFGKNNKARSKARNTAGGVCVVFSHNKIPICGC